MLRIRSGLTSCDQHDFFKNTRENAGFKTGNELCFSFGAVWQAAISMNSSKTLLKLQVSKQETSHALHSERFGKLRSAWFLQKHWGTCRFQSRKRAMLCIRGGLASCDQHDFLKNTRENGGFNTGNEPCFAFGAVWQAAISMISSKTIGNMQVSKQETSYASHSKRLGKLRSAWFLQKH